MADEDLLSRYGFEEEVAEEFNAATYGAYVKTGFPAPKRRYRLVYESERASLEEGYYWVLNACRQDFGFSDVTKTLDTFTGSENSSFWGMTHQRQSIQQDRASQYLATIGKMVKEVFQIVREIRIIKERLKHYDGAKKGSQADDVALKSYWADMVEGGTKGQMNIYQMAQQVGFGTLPDLFFSIYVKDGDDINKKVDDAAKEFNDKVKSVLKQKLAKYVAWKQETDKELRTRERFTLRYLRQHWASIRMYMSWVKPYLRNVQKLQSPDKHERNPDLVSSFEGAIVEIEFIARQAPKGKDQMAATILASFTYRVKPQMEFHEKGGYQHKGPVHIGRLEFSLRSYGWTQEDVEKYMQYRDEETLRLLNMADDSIQDAMDALGDELKQYLKEAGQDVTFGAPEAPAKKEKKPEGQSMIEPFVALFGGFKEILSLPFGPIGEAFAAKKESKKAPQGKQSGYEKSAGTAASLSFQVYKNFKKSHGPMPTW